MYEHFTSIDNFRSIINSDTVLREKNASQKRLLRKLLHAHRGHHCDESLEERNFETTHQMIKTTIINAGTNIFR